MDAVTYPNQDVAAFISEYLIPIRVRSNAIPLSEDFTVKWTPTHVMLDTKGKEHNRTVGFVPAEEMIPVLLMGMAKTCFDLDDLDQAMVYLDQIIRTYPKGHSAPGAIYLRGVSGYLATHDAKNLKQIYEKLRDAYPQSVWAQRSLPYRLL
jgi:TolA-binding protein